jgi:hypothetical protein
MPTAKTGNRKRTTKGLRKVIPRLLTQRVVLEVINTRRGTTSSQTAIRIKPKIKHATRIVTSFFIVSLVCLTKFAQGANKEKGVVT